MKWRGIFKVIPRSIIDSSQELTKASKMELFNMLIPILQFPPELYAKPVKQILKIQEEDAEDWLPQSWLDALEAKPEEEEQKPPLFTKIGEQQQQPPIPPGMPGAGMLPMPQSPETMQAGAGATPGQAQTVVPKGQVSSPTMPQLGGGAGNIFKRRL